MVAVTILAIMTWSQRNLAEPILPTEGDFTGLNI
jgi:hypothetical protein